MDPIKALIRFLKTEGLLDSEPSEEIFHNTLEGAIRVLDRNELIDEDEVIKRLSSKLDIQIFTDTNTELTEKVNVEKFLSKIEPELCLKQKVLPLFEEDNIVVVATSNPFDVEGLKSIEFSLGMRTKPILANESEITKLLNSFLPAPSIDLEEYDNLDMSENVEIISSSSQDKTVGARDAETPPIIKLCNKIIADAVSADASDIHIEPTQSGVEVRFRIDGIMHGIFEIPKRLQAYVLTRFKILSGMDIAERRKPQDGRIRVILHSEPIDLRASSVPTSFGEKMVFRILRSNVDKLNFEALSIPQDIINKLNRNLSKSGKLILVTGPTGSGKTTTLYSCLNRLRDGTTNIETVEDPIEYRVPGIHQIQVNQAAGVTFASALRSVLRQDPDVIMIGEIRDKETAEIALQAAQTGHQVLSTLHTNTAPAAISRLLTIGVDPFVMASCLSAVIAQRLVRKICPECSKPASKSYLEKHQDIINDYKLDKKILVETKGCKACNHTGYKGRVGIYSFLEITDELEDLILTKAPMSDVVTSARKNGFKSLTESAVERLKESLTTLDEIRPYYLSDDDAPEVEESTVETKTEAIKEPEVVEISETSTEKKSGIEKKKIVLVEDDEDVRRILSLLLEKEMYEVIPAENGLEGINAVYEHHPTVVLCDLMMPVMDGKDFLIKMQSNKDTNRIPVIILTAADSESNETELLDLGASDFVSKTSSSSVMLSRLRRILSTLEA